MSKGLLLLDVDGPLNPYEEKGHNRDRLPLEYKTLRLRPRGFEWAKNPLRVWVSEAHGPMLLAFAAEYDLELAWATTWVDEANTMIGPEIGLPELPFVPFAGHPSDNPGWKYPEVLEFAAGRPLVWCDDEFKIARGGRIHAQSKFLQDRGSAPTLLHHVSPRLGITQFDLDSVGRWLKENV